MTFRTGEAPHSQTKLIVELVNDIHIQVHDPQRAVCLSVFLVTGNRSQGLRRVSECSVTELFARHFI